MGEKKFEMVKLPIVNDSYIWNSSWEWYEGIGLSLKHKAFSRESTNTCDDDADGYTRDLVYIAAMLSFSYQLVLLYYYHCNCHFASSAFSWEARGDQRSPDDLCSRTRCPWWTVFKNVNLPSWQIYDFHGTRHGLNPIWKRLSGEYGCMGFRIYGIPSHKYDFLLPRSEYQAARQGELEPIPLRPATSGLTQSCCKAEPERGVLGLFDQWDYVFVVLNWVTPPQFATIFLFWAFLRGSGMGDINEDIWRNYKKISIRITEFEILGVVF